MRRIIIFTVLISISLLFCCKQNGDYAKQKNQEFEEISREIEMLENNKSAESQDSEAPVYDVKVLKAYPHDPSAYTQGMVFHDGYFYESTGLVGHSTLRKVEVETGKILESIKVKGTHFAEGIEIFDDKIYQLTWISQTCFVYDIKTLELVNSFSYRGEGWGLTKIDDYLVMSNGSNKLKFLNPKNFEEIKTLEVHDGKNPVYSLNELEYIKDEIWANIYQQDKIVRINPETGKVNSYLNLSPLYKYLKNGVAQDVLNGIAYDSQNDRIYLTGKLWEFVFWIEIEK